MDTRKTVEEKTVVDTDSGHSPPSDLDNKIVVDDQGEKVFADLPPDPDAGCTDEERARIERQLLWKLDLKLIPWLSFLYLISFLDRKHEVSNSMDL